MTFIKTKNDIVLVWDSTGGDIDHYEIYRAPYLPIATITPGSKQFVINCPLEGWFAPEDAIEVTGTSDPAVDGSYTIDAVAYDPNLEQITITVLETIASAATGGYLGQTMIAQLAGLTNSTHYTDKEMPLGYYYYLVYAVDDADNYLSPSEPVVKWSPQDATGPAAPGNIYGTRTDKLDAVELTWDEVTDPELKGYLVWRTIYPYTSPTPWELIATTSSPKYKDSNIPLNTDPDYYQTFVGYFVQAYDKTGNLGYASTTVGTFSIPTIKGTRAALDYDALNVYWDALLPETYLGAVAIWLAAENGNLGLAGASEWPHNFLRVNGPLNTNMKYGMKASCVPSGMHKIINQNHGGSWIEIAGDLYTLFPTNHYIGITNSAGFDGTYKIVSSAAGTPCRIEITPAPHDGYAITEADQTYNSFLVYGNHANNFTGDKIILTVSSGVNAGTYTVTKAVNEYNATRIYVKETIPTATATGTLCSGKILNLTTAYTTLQDPIVSISVPNYETDEEKPTAPYGLVAQPDPENRRIFLNWSRVLLDDDFLDYHIELSMVGDFALTGVTAASEVMLAGDVRAYFPAGSKFQIRNSTLKDGEYTVISTSYGAGTTTILLLERISASVIDGYACSELAWFLLEKTKQTSYQAYFNWAYASTYYLRVRAVDRNGNKSLPGTCETTVVWQSPDLADAYYKPSWVEYTESISTIFTAAGTMRSWQLSINDSARYSKYFRAYVLYALQRPYTTNPSIYFTQAKSEIIARDTDNMVNWNAREMNNKRIRNLDIPGKWFEISGDFTEYFKSGDLFRISGSTDNNGMWTCDGNSTYVGSNTRIVVTGTPGATADGQIDWATFVWPAVNDWFAPGSNHMSPASAILPILATGLDP